MKGKIVLLLAFFAAIQASVEIQSGQWYTCKQVAGKFAVAPGPKGSNIAWAKYSLGMHQKGWNELNVATSGKFSDELQAKCAGYLEGYLSANEIWNTWRNWEMDQQLAPGARDFPLKNEKWVRENAARKPAPNTDYWNQVSLILHQLDGIREGYNARVSTTMPKSVLSAQQFWYLQINLELSDINATATAIPRAEDDLHCSSLVKISDDGKRLLSSQTMWSPFKMMLRVWKHVNFAFKAAGTKAQRVSYSAYPGAIPSNDDYFLTSQNMVIMETTNNVYNMSLYQYVTPQTVPYFIRIMIANRMASSGEEWKKVMTLYNSGTYNNQWIVVDNKKFTPGKPLVPGTLWVLEQIPGYLYGQDQTEYLRTNKHWSSYNIAYYPFIYNISGYPEKLKTGGDSYSWANCPRGKMFKRDQDKVQDIPTLKKFMRYNKWQSDPYSLGNSCNGIASRCDLNPVHPRPYGALDCKLTSNELSGNMTSEIIGGPTWDDQPPFAWTEQWKDTPHFGHPKVFNFEWFKVNPNN
eukprot:TRINITY_DN183_c0_g1_i1.p1 TRINITY_DN183_c0_g1~~TRINITY_DN183_c0_g1_i1.p1  ORF type:complete len:521 (-),score=165.39 TRINITY_DN183_c0_g1_i1:104-1666(-)